MIIKYTYLSFLIVTTLLLYGCAPHPGTGTWVPIAEVDTVYSRIAVEFNGQAELFIPGREEHLIRCFWSGESANSISMDCISADDTEIKYTILLQVADDGVGELLQNGAVVGRFSKEEE